MALRSGVFSFSSYVFPLIAHSTRRCTQPTFAKYIITSRCFSSKQICSTPIPEFEDIESLNSYEDLHKFSVTNPTEFWGELGRSRLEWFEDFHTVQDCDLPLGKASWFGGGKLNVTGEKKMIFIIFISIYSIVSIGEAVGRVNFS